MDVFKVMELEGSGEGKTKKRVTIVDCGELDESGARIDAGVAAADAAAADMASGGLAAVSLSDSGGLDDIDDDDDGPRIEEQDEEALVLEDGPSDPVLESQ